MRLPFSQKHRLAVTKIIDWMHATGPSVHADDASGTLFGRRVGPATITTILFESHKDHNWNKIQPKSAVTDRG